MVRKVCVNQFVLVYLPFPYDVSKNYKFIRNDGYNKGVDTTVKIKIT